LSTVNVETMIMSRTA